MVNFSAFILDYFSTFVDIRGYWSVGTALGLRAFFVSVGKLVGQFMQRLGF